MLSAIRKHDFTILLTLYFFLLPMGKTLWYPLLVMAIIGGVLFYQEMRVSRSFEALASDRRFFCIYSGTYLPYNLCRFSPNEHLFNQLSAFLLIRLFSLQTPKSGSLYYSCSNGYNPHCFCVGHIINMAIFGPKQSIWPWREP